MKTILCVFGTRPEAIKFAPLIHRLKSQPSDFCVRVCVTSQHKKMLEQALTLFDIKPDYDLNIMKNCQSLFNITIAELRELESILKIEKPDLVLVQGDTTTCFTASLAAYYSRVRIGHVEAGLRTNSKCYPFPEEINRRLTDCLADIHFAPTEKAKQNLIDEGCPAKQIFVTGNTGIDALLFIKRKVLDKRIQKKFYISLFQKNNIDPSSHRILLVTAHRRESFGKDLINICEGIKKLVKTIPDIHVIWPVHPNPNVHIPVQAILGSTERISLVDPLDYASLVWLMNNVYLILTDSGGIQEEAPTLGKPVLVLRDTTERTEGVDEGTVCLIGTSAEQIYKETKSLLQDRKTYQCMACTSNPYGKGYASDVIVEILRRELNPSRNLHLDFASNPLVS